MYPATNIPLSEQDLSIFFPSSAFTFKTKNLSQLCIQRNNNSRYTFTSRDINRPSRFPSLRFFFSTATISDLKKTGLIGTRRTLFSFHSSILSLFLKSPFYTLLILLRVLSLNYFLSSLRPFSSPN